MSRISIDSQSNAAVVKTLLSHASPEQLGMLVAKAVRIHVIDKKDASDLLRLSRDNADNVELLRYLSMDVIGAIRKVEPEYVASVVMMAQLHSEIKTSITRQLSKREVSMWDFRGMLLHADLTAAEKAVVDENRAALDDDEAFRECEALQKLFRERLAAYVVPAAGQAMAHAMRLNVLEEDIGLAFDRWVASALAIEDIRVQKVVLSSPVMMHWLELAVEHDHTPTVSKILELHSSCVSIDPAVSATALSKERSVLKPVYGRSDNRASILDLALDPKRLSYTQQVNMAIHATGGRKVISNPITGSAARLITKMGRSQSPRAWHVLRQSVFRQLIQGSDFEHKDTLLFALNASETSDQLEFVCKATLRLLHKSHGVLRHRRLLENSDLLSRLKDNPAFDFLGGLRDNYDKSWTRLFGLFATAHKPDDVVVRCSQRALLETLEGFKRSAP